MSSLGVYVQVPFCASKCSFCNFSSGVERSTVFDEYAHSLRREVEELQVSFGALGIPSEVLSFPVDSIYIGGGTPSLLGQGRLSLVVRALQHCLRFSEEMEFTLETTPGSADADFLRALYGLGGNRLSIGAQTFEHRELRAVGRLHAADDTCELVHRARQAGFLNINLDLIAGLPYQTEASFRSSLEAAIRLRPEHVSLYLFEVDEKSRLGREVIHGGKRYHADAVPSDDYTADAYEFGCAFLADEGYGQYEISNFARPGFESRHNRKYWQLAPYLGFGAGAHSFDGARRWSNQMAVRGYMTKLNAGQPPVEDLRVLTSAEQLEEFFFLGLRQVEGVSLKLATKRWGQACLRPWEEILQNLAREGRVVLQADRVRLVRSAYLISNEVFQEFVSVEE